MARLAGDAVFVAVAAVLRVIAPQVAHYFGIALQIVNGTAVAIELGLFLLLIRATYDPEA